MSDINIFLMYVSSMTPVYLLCMKLCISVCIYRRSPHGAVSSPVSDGNSSLWSRLRLGEGGAPPSEAPLYCPPLSHMDYHMGGAGYRIFHSSPSVVDECKITPFVIKHANVPICQHVVIKDLCTHTVRRTFQVLTAVRSKTKALRT